LKGGGTIRSSLEEKKGREIPKKKRRDQILSILKGAEKAFHFEKGGEVLLTLSNICLNPSSFFLRKKRRRKKEEKKVPHYSRKKSLPKSPFSPLRGGRKKERA